MLKREQLHSYQQDAVRHAAEHDNSMLWLQMGLGKTIITLTSIVDRINAGEVKKVLIFGPLRVIQSVWRNECRKWEHTKRLTCSVVHGPKDKRTRQLFLNADIYLCNYENMNWLADTLDHYYVSANRPVPFDMVVYDEVSKLKNSTTRRMAGGRKDVDIRHSEGTTTKTIKTVGWRKMIPHFKYTMGLTGTPAPNGYLDLFGQYLAVDGGQRLGSYVSHYKDAYFESDYMGWKYVPSQEGKAIIEDKIGDITLKMDAADYLDLPPVKFVNMMVDLPTSARKAYQEVEENMFTQLENGAEIELFSKQSVSNKCLQFCNGSPYVGESREFEKLHDAKLEALESVLEEAAGQPVLCSYTFKSDAKRIMQKFKKYRPVNLTETASKDTQMVLDQWKAGKIKLLIGHPASMGHGIDGLQENGSVLVWFGLNWSLELYEQMNARINRQGQKNVVTIIKILCRDTVDLAVADAIERKMDDQEGLKDSLSRYRSGQINNDLIPSFL